MRQFGALVRLVTAMCIFLGIAVVAAWQIGSVFSEVGVVALVVVIPAALLLALAGAIGGYLALKVAKQTSVYSERSKLASKNDSESTETYRRDIGGKRE